MLTRLRTATVERVHTPGDGDLPIGTASRAMRLVEHALTPLCIVAAGAAFVAETRLGSGGAAVGALGVVPVLVAAMLRARRLTLTVAAFAMLLQVWGVAAGFLDRDAAGMQISVYLLTLAVAALQQTRPAVVTADAEDIAPSIPTSIGEPVDDGDGVPSVIRVTGLSMDTSPVAYELSARVSQLLTRRERQVVVLAVQGFTAREIGAQLFIGERTVETHLSNAYSKLNVRSKVDLVRVIAAAEPREFRTGTEATEKATA
jgi:DNA-binding CsgD family transcriptional regulator